MIYCLIPYELADKLHEPLRDHYREEPGVEVVVEQRQSERRSGAGRRQSDRDAAAPGREAEDAAGDDVERPEAEDVSPTGEERRVLRADAGRRIGDRRTRVATLAEDAVPELPRRLRRHAKHLRFVERVQPAGERAEDADTARHVSRFQAGDRDAYSTLYARYFERVYSYLRVVLKDRHEAEDLAQEVFVRALKALPKYERRTQPFRAWLFVIARNAARDYLAKQARIELMDSEELDSAIEQTAAGAEDARADAELSLEETLALGWIRNQDLIVLVERLPAAQRQVLSLRYMLGLQPKQIARVMNLDPNHVSVLHYRAVNFLRERLSALGREPKDIRDAAQMTRIPQKNTVLRLRRWALDR